MTVFCDTRAESHMSSSFEDSLARKVRSQEALEAVGLRE